jgi:dihydroflavonol-4-reductase
MVKALVTGATGFIGSAIARRLISEGLDVRVLVRPNTSRQNLAGLNVEITEGDLTDSKSLKRACTGCEALFHAAADYRLWAPKPRELYKTNVDGTRALLQAAADAGISRAVYTSSVATLKASDGVLPSDETMLASYEETIGHYKRSKVMAEKVAGDFVAEGFPIVVVKPSAPAGPRDVKPTPTGRTILDAAAGKIPVYVNTGLNIVHVDDVADGHWLAYERGQPGESYILGGTDMTLLEILTDIAHLVGRKPPTIRLPHNVVLPIAYLSELAARFTGNTPAATVESVQLSKKMMFFSSEKAKRELGYRARPAIEAFEDAIRWFRDQGYLKGPVTLVQRERPVEAQ